MGEEPNIDELNATANMNIEQPPEAPSFEGMEHATPLEQNVYQTGYVAARKMWENKGLKEDNARLHTEAHEAKNHDNLTGLLNLQGITAKIQERMKKSAERSFGVLYIDFNGFKRLNDDLGHAVGDELIIAFGHKVHDTIRHGNGSPGDELIKVDHSNDEKTTDQDTNVARAGGDEFIVIVDLTPRQDDSKTPRQRLQTVGDRIRQDMTEVAASDERFKNVSAAIGGAVWTGGNSEEILREAEHQMYSDKPANSR